MAPPPGHQFGRDSLTDAYYLNRMLPAIGLQGGPIDGVDAKLLGWLGQSIEEQTKRKYQRTPEEIADLARQGYSFDNRSYPWDPGVSDYAIDPYSGRPPTFTPTAPEEQHTRFDGAPVGGALPTYASAFGQRPLGLPHRFDDLGPNDDGLNWIRRTLSAPAPTPGAVPRFGWPQPEPAGLPTFGAPSRTTPSLEDLANMSDSEFAAATAGLDWGRLLRG